MESRREFILNQIGEEIKEILYGYIKAESFTHSEKEKEAEAFFLNYFAEKTYWKEHPEYFGTCPIRDDPFGRAAAFAMVKGEGPETMVFVHHNDVVTVEDFKLLKPLAFSPDDLERELHKLRDSFSEEAAEDLDAGTYLYGRGVCDMKGGGAIQMALLSRYGELVRGQETVAGRPEAGAGGVAAGEAGGGAVDGTGFGTAGGVGGRAAGAAGADGDTGAMAGWVFRGNLIVLAVPDEENLSAGMRTAILLLAELKDKYGLDYKIMVNSEPHQRKDPDKGVFSLGSVGKLMPFLYVRGSLAHVGKVFEGFNPLNLMSGIVRKTELNMDLSDVVGCEAAPPPTWLFYRDRKIKYDVSMPLSVTGCFSILTLKQTPGTLLNKVRSICQEAFDEIIAEMNANYSRFLKATGQEERRLPWETKVVDFAELYGEAYAVHGEEFRSAYEKKMAELAELLNSDEMTLLGCNFELVDFVYNYIDDLSPRVVFGLIPPYYPNVSNLFLDRLPDTIRSIGEILGDFTKEQFGQEYVKEYFYTGISDLSYTSISDSQEITKALKDSMPFFGNLYDIPVAEIEKISMPCINIGPWGKDFHKLTERVLKEDLYERTPQIIEYAIEKILG